MLICHHAQSMTTDPSFTPDLCTAMRSTCWGQACFDVMLSCICTDALGCHRRQQAAITVLHGSPTVLMAWPGEPVGWIWIMLLHQSSRAMQPCLEMKNEAGCPMVHHLLYVALWCSTAACFYVCHHSAIQHLLASLQAQAEIGNLG